MDVEVAVPRLRPALRKESGVRQEHRFRQGTAVKTDQKSARDTLDGADVAVPEQVSVVMAELSCWRRRSRCGSGLTLEPFLAWAVHCARNPASVDPVQHHTDARHARWALVGHLAFSLSDGAHLHITLTPPPGKVTGSVDVRGRLLTALQLTVTG